MENKPNRHSYRAWDKQKKEFVKYDYDNPDDGVEVLALNGRVHHYYFIDLGYGDGAVGALYDVHTDFVLMQSTGLTDKNGKEIFEGDIIRNSNRIQVVEFKFGKWLSVDILQDDPFTQILFDSIHDAGEETHEIIGNIYENPDLLLKKEK